MADTISYRAKAASVTHTERAFALFNSISLFEFDFLLSFC